MQIMNDASERVKSMTQVEVKAAHQFWEDFAEIQADKQNLENKEKNFISRLKKKFWG